MSNSTRTRRFRETAMSNAQVDSDLEAEAEQPALDSSLEPPMSPAQRDLIRDLLTEVNLGDATDETVRQYEAGLSKRVASKWITRLIELKKAQGTAAPKPGKGIETSVPAGRYAVTGDDGTTDFYKVDRPEEGRWAGYTFVKLQTGSDYQRIGRKQAATILSRIEDAGPREASARYGHELGHCGVCGRELTNNESIEAGIGPVCSGKMGW